MGSYIFWAIIVFIVVALLVSNSNRNKNEKKAKLNLIRENFGVSHKPDKANVFINDYVKYYYSNIKEDNDIIFCIDDISWNDLNMDVIFTMLNHTFSSPGEEFLYARLHQMYQNPEEVNRFYKEINAFLGNEEGRIKASLCLNELGKLKNVSAYSIVNKLFEAKTTNCLKDLVLDILLILSFSMIFISPGIGFVLFLIMLGIMISTYFKGRALMDENIRAFCYVYNLIKTGEQLKEALGDEFEFDMELSSLRKFSFLISQKDGTNSNPISILLDYLRMIFHVDLIVYNLRLTHIVENKDQILELYKRIAYVDALISLASFVKSQPNVTKADFVYDNQGIKAVGMYHPLNRKPVCNDIDTKRGVLITGSNASGKSTFLKMVGLNLVFAQSFGFALADSFVVNPVRLYTSMALSDNIIGEESYYVVESKSLKRICDAGEINTNIFCIVDEVLRGTNTMERIAASSSILVDLYNKGTICFVATHDRELTKLLMNYYDLYYFTEEIHDKSVTFPYKIIKGVSENGNAIRLLEMLGYDQNVIAQADKLVEFYKEKGKWVADN